MSVDGLLIGTAIAVPLAPVLLAIAVSPLINIKEKGRHRR